MKNKRRHRRFTVDLMDIRGSLAFSCEILIHDISITGVSVKTDRKLDAGGEYTLRIRDDKRDFLIKSTVIWSRDNREGDDGESGSPKRYSAGLRFSGLPQETIGDLIGFIESHLIKKNSQVVVRKVSECRCSIRYHVDARGKATLNYDEKYKVKKLSLGGMLLESGRPLEPGEAFLMEMVIPGHTLVSFSGRVTSCIMARGRCDIGVEFVDIRQEDRDKLKEFIRRLYLEAAGFPVR